jgi:hypothetical protein
MIDVVCEGASGRIRPNEDTHVLHDDGRLLTLVAIDGATVRVASLAQQPLLAAYPERLTEAAYSARIARDAIRQHINLNLREMLLKANEALAARLALVYGAVTPQAIMAREPGLAARYTDVRFCRLVLPACVVTAARIDRQSHTLGYAHAGDTALFVFLADGTVEQLTGANAHDDRLFQEAQTLRARGRSMDDILQDNQIKQADIDSGVYHNYVDEGGQTHPGLGVGVIDGLPQLADYIETGQRSLDGVAGVFVCSDGAIWPDDLQTMQQIIQTEGVRAYYHRLRALERDDSTRERFPRFKVHDDFTGLYVKI